LGKNSEAIPFSKSAFMCSNAVGSVFNFKAKYGPDSFVKTLHFGKPQIISGAGTGSQATCRHLNRAPAETGFQPPGRPKNEQTDFYELVNFRC
jgi:hypothetical protein